MSLDVSREDASKVLQEAFKNPVEQTDSIGRAIRDVLRGTHKTYKYVLFTAILAKATNENVDILSIQAGDDSVGAYDARSLCHKVVVPFERDYIPHSLGDSNEPYLNKPARFPRISLENAVRNGNDYQTLKSLVDTLPQIKTKDDAKKYLSSAVHTLIEISKEYESKYKVDVKISNENAQGVLDLIDTLTERACEGEMCPLIVASLESLRFPKLIVVAHHVNECGASSKETGDIDVYRSVDGKKYLVSSIEVKDKDFSEQDVEHAISKFHSAELDRSLFVFGKKAHFSPASVYQVAARLGRIGVFCAVISIMEYAKMRLYEFGSSINPDVFVKRLMEYAQSINATEDTLQWIKQNLGE